MVNEHSEMYFLAQFGTQKLISNLTNFHVHVNDKICLRRKLHGN